MMKRRKRFFAILLVLTVLCSMTITAYAADASFVYEGHNLFNLGSGSEFTDTDLFANFKNVLPGDVLTETITVKNTASCCDFIKVYLRAVPHGDDNGLSEKVAEAETLVSMGDFLSQLTMIVWNGSTQIYEGSPDETDGLSDNVLLGTFRRNEGTSLTVELRVPIELGNAYADRVGEVDWMFVVEEYDDVKPDIPQTGDQSPTIPSGQPSPPHTGDQLHIVLYAVLVAVSFAGIVLLLVMMRRKKK